MIISSTAIVIGGGPAGMAAAIELDQAGVNTVIIDQSFELGGTIYHRGLADSDNGISFRSHKLSRGKALKQNVYKGKRITVLTGATVWEAASAGVLNIEHMGRTLEARYDVLIICEGAQERVIPCNGWTLPGVYTLGGLQKFANIQGVIPKGRVLLAGSGPLLIPTAATLANLGANVVGLYEAGNPKKLYGLLLGMLNWPRLIPETLKFLPPLVSKCKYPKFGWTLANLRGGERVQEATVVKLDDSGMPIFGSEKIIEVDAVGIGFGLQPVARLPRMLGCEINYNRSCLYFSPRTDFWGKSSLSNVYIAGDGAAIGGADWSEVQGRLSGLHAAYTLNAINGPAFQKMSSKWKKAKQKLQRYLKHFYESFTPSEAQYRMIAPDTVICRCEGLTIREIRARIESGENSLTGLKKIRLGMGVCQGRGCEGTVAELLRLSGISAGRITPFNLRPPLFPIRLSAFNIA